MPNPKPKERPIMLYLDVAIVAAIDRRRKKIGLTRKKYLEEILKAHILEEIEK